jgi:hypothetical protein
LLHQAIYTMSPPTVANEASAVMTVEVPQKNDSDGKYEFDKYVICKDGTSSATPTSVAEVSEALFREKEEIKSKPEEGEDIVVEDEHKDREEDSTETTSSKRENPSESEPSLENPAKVPKVDEQVEEKSEVQMENAALEKARDTESCETEKEEDTADDKSADRVDSTPEDNF